MTDSTMLYLVAEAISCGEVLPEDLAVARRAIAAMLKPTLIMKQVGGGFFEEGETSDNERAGEIVYRAMIEAALAQLQASVH